MNRTRTTFLLDSLASYWNTFIPYQLKIKRLAPRD
nr:MAG TPA: hypothetical protein [Caudoviricetes sp.]